MTSATVKSYIKHPSDILGHVQAITTPMTENTIQTETLDILAEAKNYNQRILQQLLPYVGESLLEIGCGTGTFTQHFIEKASHVTALDVVAEYVPKVYQTVQCPEGKVLDVRCQNVFETTEGIEPVESVVMLNVLEHIEDDMQAVQTLNKLLLPGGRLMILVPAHQFLYSDYDRSIHHYRRYTTRSLNQVLTDNGFAIQDSFYFNFIGIFGWWMRFCLLKKDAMEPASVKLFDKLSPLFGMLEQPFRLPLGLSVITIATKL